MREDKVKGISLSQATLGSDVMQRHTATYTRRAAPWMFLAPFLMAFITFSLYPLARTLVLSTQYAAGTEAAVNVGVDNYTFAAGDPLVWLAGVNTLGFALGFAIVQVPWSLLLAIVVDHAPARLRGGLIGIFFSTHLVGTTFAGVLFAAMLSGRRGLVNAVLLNLGVIDAPIGWLQSTAMAMPLLILAGAYLGAGFGMLYLLAALRRVDANLLDAARVEGAGPLRRFWHVTLPQVRPTLAFLFVAAVFYGLQAFELPYVMFGGAGPGYRVLTAVMYLFAVGFEQGDLGLASAIGVMFAVAVAGLTIVLAKVLRLGGEEVSVG